MKKTKPAIPPEYRRNRKQDFIDFLLMFATCLGIVVALCFLLLM